MLLIAMMNEILDSFTSKWMLQPVRRCCKGSQLGRVAPAFICFSLLHGGSMKDKIKYIIPAGTAIRPSQVGYYNFWYPHMDLEFESYESFVVEPMSWTGSDEWAAVMVSADKAITYKSPIKVLWVKKQIIKDIEGMFYLRKGLEGKEETTNER